MPGSHAPDAPESRRLVVTCVHPMTALAETLVEAIAGRLHPEAGRNLVVSETDHALARLLREKGLAEVRTMDAVPLPPIAEPRQGVEPRRAFLGRVIAEDDFLTTLPLAGSEVSGNDIFFWDRLQWLVGAHDPRPFVSSLPWDTITDLVLVGGQTPHSNLPALLLAEARRRSLPVQGAVHGPVLGRYAPLWLHGCDTLHVADEEAVGELFALGATIPIDVDPRLACGGSVTPLDVGMLDRSDIILDVDVTTLHAPAREALTDFATAHRDALGTFLLPIHSALVKRMEKVYGERLGGVPLRVVEGHPLQEVQKRRLPVLSFEPYAVLHATPALGPVRLGVLEAAVRNAHGGLPRRLAPLVVATRASSGGARP